MKTKPICIAVLFVMTGLMLQASFTYATAKGFVQPNKSTQIRPKGSYYLNLIGIFKPHMFFYQEAPVYSSTEVSTKPEFFGGADALAQFVNDHLKYPDAAIKVEKEGRIWVEAIIEKEGTISDVRISRGMGFGCDEEAIRLVKSMPRWKPGKLQDNPVRVKVNIPVTFKMP